MSGLWDNPGVPHKGWRCVTVNDLEPESEMDYASCEMCGRERIRYVHVMEHDTYQGELEVGCICAEKMSGDYVNPRRLEQRLKNRAARKAKWLKRRWRTSVKGNAFLNAEGHNLVFPNTRNPSKWSFRIDKTFSRKLYGSQEEAKLAMFDEFWNLLDDADDDLFDI